MSRLPFLRRVVPLFDWLSVRLRDRHIRPPVRFGQGAYDCALESLYWAAPSLSEARIIEAFQRDTFNWPYQGVTNSEFHAVLERLGLTFEYSDETRPLSQFLAERPRRGVVLLWGHFVAVVDGRVAGCAADVRFNGQPSAEVVCTWTLR